MWSDYEEDLSFTMPTIISPSCDDANDPVWSYSISEDSLVNLSEHIRMSIDGANRKIALQIFNAGSSEGV